MSNLTKGAIIAAVLLGMPGCTSSPGTSPDAAKRFADKKSALTVSPPLNQSAESKVDTKAYEALVKSTSSFGFTQDTAADVRKFLENGGMFRTEKQPVSQKIFSTVLLFEREVKLATGTANITGDSGQGAQNTYVTLSPGIYIFNYDTEAGLTLRSMADLRDVARVSIKPEDRSNLLTPVAIKISVTAQPENLEIIRQSIESTVRLYKDNFQMASLMEMALDGLYSVGNRKKYTQFEEAFQSEAGLRATKSLVRELMSFLEESLVRDYSVMIGKMTVEKMAFTPIENVDMARRELLAANQTTDNMYVLFGSENGRLVMYVYNGTEFSEGSQSYNPLLLYRISGTESPLQPNFPNSFTKEFGGFVDGPDYDNDSLPAEQGMEDRLTEIYQKVSGKNWITTPNSVKIFNLRIDANVQQMLDTYKNELESEIRKNQIVQPDTGKGSGAGFFKNPAKQKPKYPIFRFRFGPMPDTSQQQPQNFNAAYLPRKKV